MKRVFDTPFEMSLRLVLLFSAGGETAKTADMLALTDTIAIYGGTFGIADANLHGGIDYVLDEYDTRRELIKAALKDLVLRGLARIMDSGDGFLYGITDNGRRFAGKLESAYAAEYLELAKAASALTAAKSERDIFKMIREVCETSLGGERGNA
jgi:hypothetical protein